MIDEIDHALEWADSREFGLEKVLAAALRQAWARLEEQEKEIARYRMVLEALREPNNHWCVGFPDGHSKACNLARAALGEKP